ncbi:MAG: hypothetical protein FWE12_05870 [Oscillospiraceae bacterium]|nr:hypothetical protein [Oscillospiraceae bacterium]
MSPKKFAAINQRTAMISSVTVYLALLLAFIHMFAFPLPFDVNILLGIALALMIANFVSVVLFWKCTACRKRLPLHKASIKPSVPDVSLTNCPHCNAEIT